MRKRELQWRLKDGADTIIMVEWERGTEIGEVVATWEVADDRYVHAFRNPGNLEDWANTYPVSVVPAYYGDHITDPEQLEKRQDICRRGVTG